MNYRHTAPPGVPGADADDLYLQPGGGFGSRAADQLERERQAREQQQRAEQRAQQQPDGVVPSAVFVSDKLAALEQQVADLAQQVAELSERVDK